MDRSLLPCAPGAPSPLPPDGGRIASLDAARAFAVLAMVLGHTLDALLAPEVRAEPLVAAYWTARGFTAPLFMIVAGWAVTVAAARGGARGLALVRARLPRVLLLLALGFALRWPGWGVSLLREGDHAVWAHLLAFDALHTIAVALLLISLVLAAPLRAAWRAGVFGALLVGAVALGSVPLGPRDPAALPLLALAQAVGGTAAFPLFPWVGYCLLGAILGLLCGRGEGRRALALSAAGAALAAAALLALPGVEAAVPRVFAFRAGVVLVLLAALAAVPAALATRLRPVGRASLAVYVIHLPIVYGWSTHEGLLQRLGPRLPLGAAVAIGVAVLALALALAVGVGFCARSVAEVLRALGTSSADDGGVGPGRPATGTAG